MSEYQDIHSTDTSSDSAGTDTVSYLVELLYNFLYYPHAFGIFLYVPFQVSRSVSMLSKLFFLLSTIVGNRVALSENYQFCMCIVIGLGFLYFCHILFSWVYMPCELRGSGAVVLVLPQYCRCFRDSPE